MSEQEQQRRSEVGGRIAGGCRTVPRGQSFTHHKSFAAVGNAILICINIRVAHQVIAGGGLQPADYRLQT